MMNQEAIMNLVGLMATCDFEMRALPDDLQCAQCKSVLKDAWQMPCDCRFCRACVDDMMASGTQFCPGGLQHCGGTPLSTAQRDYRANNRILKLAVKCPHSGCSHECPLADVESHMRACSRRNIGCPFRELGCEQGALPGEEMSGHLLQESRSHNEMLIGLVTNVNREVEVLKRELVLRDEQGRHLENEMKLIIDENKSIKNVNEAIKVENESIKREREVLTERVQRLAEILEREIDERRQSDDRVSTGISVVTEAVASNRNALGTEMEPVRDDIRSMKDQLDSMKCRMESVQSLQVALGVGQLDDWLIDVDLGNTEWVWRSAKTSGTFRGGGRPLKYELESWNYASGGELRIHLRIWAGPSDALLEWPFRGALIVTVASRNNAEKCVRKTLQCEIERPPDNQCSYATNPIIFKHAALRGAGLDLERGVRVSCQIVPGAGY